MIVDLTTDKSLLVKGPFPLADLENNFLYADVINGLSIIPDGVVTLIFTSPPYNLKIGYNNAEDDQPYADYVAWLGEVFKQCYRVLRKGGRLAINIDAMTNRQEDKGEAYIRDIRTDLAIILRTFGFKFYGEHIWYKSNLDPSHNSGQFNGKKTAWGSYMRPSTPAVRRNHEYVLVYSKEQFTLDPDTNSGSPDISDTDFQNFIASVWSIQPETRKLGNHPVPFPLKLPLRAIKLYTYPNDLVLDPFMGVGTTALAAKTSKRRFIGIDMDKDYCEYSIRRMRKDREIDFGE